MKQRVWWLVEKIQLVAVNQPLPLRTVLLHAVTGFSLVKICYFILVLFSSDFWQNIAKPDIFCKTGTPVSGHLCSCPQLHSLRSSSVPVAVLHLSRQRVLLASTALGRERMGEERDPAWPTDDLSCKVLLSVAWQYLSLFNRANADKLDIQNIRKQQRTFLVLFCFFSSKTHRPALNLLTQALEAAVTYQRASYKPVYPTENWSPCLENILYCHR